jgi:Zn-dependent M28 family amino/carboxypeptidase
MRTISLFILLLTFISCGSSHKLKNDSKKVIHFSTIIKEGELKVNLYELASDKYEGRETGEKGLELSATYLHNYYKNLGIQGGMPDASYFQNFKVWSRRDKDSLNGKNVLAFIKGKSKPNEIIVISAHYDHLGMKNNETYFGADDDGSGTVAVMQIAKAFKVAKDKGYAPERSILFLHFAGEEKGLLGSNYYTNNPVYPLKQTVTDLNIDMIGRVDEDHEDEPNYLYLIGADRISQELHNISARINKEYIQLNLDYKYNEESDPNRFYYRSDHYNFAKHGIPVIFYFNGTHKDYHKPTDTPDKINYQLLTKRTKLIFITAWKIINNDKRLKIKE